MRMTKVAGTVARVALVLAVAGGLAGLGAGTASAAGCQGWTGSQPSSSTNLNVVAVVSACDVWAESPSGFAHWTGGTTWVNVPDPVPGTLVTGMTVLSASDIWAVGYSAATAATGFTVVILHWDGSNWTRRDSPVTLGSLNAVQAVSASDIWAVGQDGSNKPLALHWNGASWAKVTVPPGLSLGAFGSVAAVSAGNVWIAGDGNASATAPDKVVIEHWDGSSLQVAPGVPSPGSISGSMTLSAASASDIWAVGVTTDATTGTGRTLIEHYNGQGWAQVYSPNATSASGQPFSDGLNVVDAISVTNAWAFGGYIGDSGTSRPLALHWNGTIWAQTVAPVDTLGTLAAAASGSEPWLLGGSATANNNIVEPVATAQIAVNANAALGLTGWTTKSVPAANLAPGTNPAVAFQPDSGWKVAWQASNGLLWTLDSTGRQVNTGQQVAAGTSPGIAALTSGGYEIVYTSATNGAVQEIGPGGPAQAAGTGPAAATGTSPVIASDGSGGFKAAYHATKTDHLWTVGTGNPGSDSGAVMAAGASPAITHLPGGGFEVAYPAASGALSVVGADNSIRALGSGPAVAAGTSPAVAAATARGGGFEAVYQAASTGELWSVDPAGSTHDLGVSAAAQTSPAVAALLAGGFEVAYQATAGRELFTLAGAGPARDSGFALGVHDSPVMAVLPPTVPGTTTVPDLSNLSDADAQAALTAAGLARGSITTDNSCRAAAGIVTGQSPAPGTSAVPGDAVALAESSGKSATGGPCNPVVPNLFGDDDATAQQAVTGQGLTVGQVTTGSSCLVDKGDVFSQNPSANTAATPGQAVSFVESNGLDKNNKPCNVQ